MNYLFIPSSSSSMERLSSQTWLIKAVKQLGEVTMCRKNANGMHCFQGKKEEREKG